MFADVNVEFLETQTAGSNGVLTAIWETRL